MELENTENTFNDLKPLRYHEKLDGFRDTIETYYSEKTIDVYRTVMTNPPTDADLVPQRYRNKSTDEINELLIEYTEEDIAEFTQAEKREEVGHDSISVNISPQKCKSEAIRAYRGVKKNYSPQIAEEFKSNRGPYVARLHICPEHGLLTKFKKGHGNLLLREDVHISDIWDEDFPLIEFDYDAELDEQG